MTHLQQLLADALASQAEAAAEDCGADAWSAVTAGIVTQAEYYEALRADQEEEDAHHWQAYCDGDPLPAELTDDDICPPNARAAGALKRAWRELVTRLNP